MRATNYIREHFVDHEFIHEFQSLCFNYYDGPLSGMLNIYGHYFFFNVEEMPEWRENGKLDEDGDNDYDFYTGKFELKPISKIRAYWEIIQAAWFHFCVYRKGYSDIRGKCASKLVKWADALARKKPFWVHRFTYQHLFMGGTYASRDKYHYSII